jgi:hypothetical protein
MGDEECRRPSLGGDRVRCRSRSPQDQDGKERDCDREREADDERRRGSSCELEAALHEGHAQARGRRGRVPLGEHTRQEQLAQLLSERGA